MRNIKKFSITAVMISFLFIGIFASTPPEPPKPKNLKILPKNISHEDLDKIMHQFRDALGVKCNFCHAANKDTSIHIPDFASDEKPEKNIARKMMRMTAKINKKYFSFASVEEGDNNPSVTCMTCHRGNPQPNKR